MTEKEILRGKLYKDFEFFVRYFFKKNHGRKFIVNHHHKKIIDKLYDVVNGNCNRLIINIAPRYSKTEIVVKNFIAWSIMRNPKSRFIHLSYSDQLALDNSEEIKDIITSHDYQQLFPYVQIKPDSKAKNKWYTTAKGGVLARSASGQVTGFGAGAVDQNNEEDNEFSGAIIIDDPIKPDDADSDTLREKVNNKFDTTIRNRVNSRNTPIIVIMQRLHQNDLCGYLLENEPGDWDVVSMPVITEDNEPLWQFKHTHEELEKLREINEFVFDTQYMQDPKPKAGLLFPKDELNYYESFDKDEVEAKIGSVDPAGDGEDNTSAPIGYIVGNKVYIEEVVFTAEGTELNIPLVAELINRHKPDYVRVETNMSNGMYLKVLEEKVSDTVGVMGVRASTNKHTRITTMAWFIKNHFVFKKDYSRESDYARFMNQLTSYLKNGKSKHDDAADSLEILATMSKNFYSHLWD